MPSQDWGPFPRLAALLGKMSAPAEARWVRQDWAPHPILARLESLWDPYVLQFVQTLRRRVGRSRTAVPSGGGEVPGRGTSPRQSDAAQLAAAVVECCTWLAGRNARRLAPFFSPFWGDIPVGLYAVSSRGIVWALYAFVLDTQGPGAIPAKGDFVPATKHPLNDSSTAGDLLALHFAIEFIVESLPGRLDLPISMASKDRRPGGLRSHQFLLAYPALGSSGMSRAAGTWRRAVDRLIAGSPLTRLVYADLSSGSVEAAELGPLLLPRTVPTDGGDTDGLNGPVESGMLWRDVWASVLAKSMLGVVLSDVPSLEERVALAERIGQLEGKAATWAATPSLLLRSAEEYRPLRAALKRREALRVTRATQRVGKLRVLAGAVRGGAPASAYPYLHARFLDMLVRRVVVTATPAMAGEIRAMRPLPRPRALFGEDRAAFTFFQEALLGQPLLTLLPELDDDARQSLRESLSRLLNRPGDEALEPARLATQSGVPEVYAQRLSARLTQDELGGIALPFPPPNHRGPTPAVVLGDWLGPLLDQIPAETVRQVTVEAAET